jgi:uncharacterized peroxidase-related enzyme
MSRLSALDCESTNDTVKAMLEQVQEDMGMVPAILRVIANSTAALEGFLAMQNCLDAGVLDKRLRRQIALAVSQANGSGYCVAAHSALGKVEGLSEEALRDARQGNTPNRRTDAALNFSRALGERPTQPLDEFLSRLHDVGFTEAEVAEIIAYAALVNLTNYFSHASAVALDFPSVDLLEANRPTSSSVD